MPFTSCGGNLKDIFITEYEIIDRYVGNQLWNWGFNNGRLGNNAITNQSSPVQTLSGGTNWKRAETGLTSDHSAGIKTDGTLWLWGCGASGTLATNSLTNRSSPVQTVSGGTNWKEASLGEIHTISIKTDGTLWAWGNNIFGQVGTNARVDHSSPVQTVSGGTNWKQVSAGSLHSAAIKTDGSLWLWGAGDAGRLGNNAITNQSSPVQTVSGGTNWKQVSLGSAHSAAIKTDGTLWLWGNNGASRLGNHSTIDQSSPVQTVSGGTNWKQVSVGLWHSAAIKTDGTMWLWGCNSTARLGTNTLTNQSSPVQTVSGGTNWKQVSAGQVHSAAIKTDGTMWLWGEGGFGRLGTNDVTNQSSPVQTVSGGTNWKQVSAGEVHTAAVTFTES